MARIVALVSNPCTGDARVIKIARAAHAAGHEVHVIATLGNNVAPYEIVDGVTYHRISWRPASLLTRDGPLRLLGKVARPVASWLARQLTPYLKYRLFAENVTAYAAALKPDLVHAHDLICLKAGHAIAREAGAKLVFDSHELEVHRNPPLPWLQKRTVSLVERRYARQADAIISVGRLVSGVLARHVRRPIHVIYNAPMLEPCQKSIRADLQLPPDAPLMVYVGKVAEGRGISDVIRMLPNLPGVMFAAVGPVDARARKRILRQAERLGLSRRFRILPPVPHEQVVSYISGANLGVISVEPVTLSYRYCMPNKLFEMAFANIPILSNDLDEIREFLAELGIGKVVDFEDVNALPLAIYEVLANNERYRMDEAKYAELEARYSWRAQAEGIASIYGKLLGVPAPDAPHLRIIDAADPAGRPREQAA